MTIKAKPDKEAVVRQLLGAKEKGQALELQLLVRNETAKAEELDNANREITEQIRTLLASMMRDWAGEIDDVTARLAIANDNLRKDIAAVTNRIQTAKNVVSFIGELDGMVAVAKKLLI